MWEADRVELIEDCVALARRASARTSSPALLPMVAVEARFGQRHGRREAGVAVADRADRDRAALGRAASARADRPGQLGRGALAVPRGRLQERREVRARSPASCRAGGCCSCRCTCSRRRSCSGSTRPRGGGRVRVPDAQGRVPRRRLDARGHRRTARRRASRCSTRSSPPRGSGDFIIAPSEGACKWCPFNTICPGANGGYAERKEGDERLAPARDPDPEHPVSDAARPGGARADRRRPRVEPRRRGRRGHRQDDGARRAGHERARERCRDRRSAGRDHVHREGGRRALDPCPRRARAASGQRRGRGARARAEAAARDLYRCHIETIHSFASSLLRERPVEAGIDPLFDVVDGLAGSALVRRRLRGLPGRAAVLAQPGARPRAAPRVRPRRDPRGVRADQPVPLPAPAQHSRTRGRRARNPPRRVPPDRRRAAGAARPLRPRRRRRRGDRRGDHRVDRPARRRSAPRPSRSSSCSTAPRADTHLSTRLEGELGRGQGAAEGAPAGVPRRARRRQGRAAHRRAAEPAAADRAVRRRLRAPAAHRPASPTSTTCCSGRATCCATNKPARDYFRRRYRSC